MKYKAGDLVRLAGHGPEALGLVIGCNDVMARRLECVRVLWFQSGGPPGYCHQSQLMEVRGE